MLQVIELIQIGLLIPKKLHFQLTIIHARITTSGPNNFCSDVLSRNFDWLPLKTELDISKLELGILIIVFQVQVLCSTSDSLYLKMSDRIPSLQF